MKVKGVSIGDIHFGIKDSFRLYNELSQFKKFIKENDIKLLVFNGDYFDSKISLTDPEAFYAISFFRDIVEIAKEKNIIIRMIQGTRSHDLNQLQLFKPFETETGLDLRIIENVEVEELLGMKIIYIPEEYPENSDEYYKNYKTDEYNICFCHGTWDFVAQPGVIDIANRTTHSAPVLFWKEWKECFKNGFVSAGHIHGRNTYSNKIFYPGSFTRWNYGERSEKGFTYFEYDTDSLTYDVKYIDNTEAPRYDVTSMSELGVDINNTPIEDVSKMIREALEKTDNLKVDLSGLSEEHQKILKETFKDNASIKIEVRSKKSMLKESANAASQDFKKWQYITKRELPLNETIKKYCKEELDKEIDLDVIDNILKVKGGDENEQEI